MPDILRDGRQRGWFHIDNALLDDFGARIGVYGVAVYATLARHADAQGVCFPSYQGIANKLAVSRRQIIRTVAVLVECGLIRVQTRCAPGKRPQNVYVLTDDWCRKGTDAPPTLLSGAGESPINGDRDAPVTDMQVIGDSPAPGLVTEMHPKKTQRTTPRKQTQGREKSLLTHTRDAIPLPDDFTVSDTLYAYAAEKGVSRTEADAMTERFTLYWGATATNGLKTDWEKAWKSWLIGDLTSGKVGLYAEANDAQHSPSIYRRTGGTPDARDAPSATDHGPFAAAFRSRSDSRCTDVDAENIDQG